MKRYIVLVVCLFAVSTAHAILIYNITWDNPPHRVGRPPAVDLTGSSSDRPRDAQKVVIRDDVDIFDNEPVAVFTDQGYAYLAFRPAMTETVSTSGTHLLTWSAAVLSFSHSQLTTAVRADNFYFNCHFLNSGRISVVPGEDLDGITWSLGNVYDFEMLFDLDNHLFSFSIDGKSCYEVALSEDVAFYGFQFGRIPYYGGAYSPRTGELAIDNIRWEYTPKAIPEPTTLGLLLLGSGLLAAKRKK